MDRLPYYYEFALVVLGTGAAGTALCIIVWGICRVMVSQAVILTRKKIADVG